MISYKRHLLHGIEGLSTEDVVHCAVCEARCGAVIVINEMYLIWFDILSLLVSTVLDCVAVACTDILKGGAKRKEGHIQRILATEEGTLAHVFATQEGSLSCFNQPRGQFSVFSQTRGHFSMHFLTIGHPVHTTVVWTKKKNLTNLNSTLGC